MGKLKSNTHSTVLATVLLLSGIVQSDEIQKLSSKVVSSGFGEINVCDKPGPFDDLIPPIETLRMVTKEELAFHDGNQTETMWLSILSKVYDVTAAPEYYSPTGTYRVFVGRDANVPFITGNFSADEAAKSLLELENHQVFALDHWSKFYDDEEKYPFVGLLIGELYDEHGNITETMKKVQEKLNAAKLVAAERRKRQAELIEKRKREIAEKKQNQSNS